ncbi:hypothetical protein M4I32_02325 [Microbacterium sp. LRZ72]|uniref:hypothetical protein n=1 Tax=Microbacterium sp. LRZ72 TaxID=2942481 RepID=UPI0029AEDA46|nr:hypothetical protein [Microbacterium sp. LRZ72]MDX2375633.1 hypothetical protein [Microbacterium sp. LRZ72]
MQNPSSQLVSSGSRLDSRAGMGAMSLSTQRQVRREVERVQTRAIIAGQTEEARAAIANLALEHVGALTALEQHLITVAPLGEARYREIVDSYTLGAAAAVRRWS